MSDAPEADVKCRWWCRPALDWFFLALVVVEGVLLLSRWFGWFGLGDRKGWAVLIAVATVCLAVGLVPVAMAASLAFRRRLQFSLAAMFVVPTVVAIACSWLAVEVHQARRQREAFEVLQEYAGMIHYHYELEPGGAIPRLLGKDFFDDVELVCLGNISDTEKLTNTELAHIGQFSKLKSLYIAGTAITDAGLEHLGHLDKLEDLCLSETPITDAGLAQLASLTELADLDLAGTRITDAGLEHLKGLTGLGELCLDGTEVTDEGVKKLQQALPNCKIEH